MDDILQPTEIKERYIPKVNKREEQMQKQICHYIKLIKPTVIFRSDISSGRWETSNYQKHLQRAMNSGRSWPDLMIYEPMECTMKDGTKQKYCGMAIELKVEGTTIMVTRGPRKGHLTSDPHIQEQYLMLKELAKKGWYTNFACGFDEFEYIFCWYFGLPKPDNTKLF